jgi:hypothetical protein
VSRPSRCRVSASTEFRRSDRVSALMLYEVSGEL